MNAAAAAIPSRVIVRTERILPRLLTRSVPRAYLGDLPWGDVLAWMRAGRLPRPLHGLPPEHKSARWDIRAVDRALDAASASPNDANRDREMLDRTFGLA